jgi:endonuclease/exonuclease/phosphatase family metal-dependent hydrolase
MALILILLLILLLVALALANSFRAAVVVDERPGASMRPAGSELMVLTWNIGYAGLGKDSDFIADGGKHLRAAGKGQVEANLSGIRRTLAGFDADLLLIQEAAGPGFLTRGVNVAGGVREQLAGYRFAFSPDVSTRLLPRSLSLRHGLATFTRLEASPTEIEPLPEEPGRIGGILPRRYHLQRTRLSGGGSPFVVYNVHLAAFDERAETRRRQVDAVFRVAKADYEAGAAVVLGGDWNLLLARTEFPHTTDAKHLSWVHPFPQDAIPPGWRIAADAGHPTVRTNERPYRPGQNYTAVIDGFIVSPNVTVLAVTTRDLGFEHADHQPVLGRFARAGSHHEKAQDPREGTAQNTR